MCVREFISECAHHRTACSDSGACAIPADPLAVSSWPGLALLMGLLNGLLSTAQHPLVQLPAYSSPLCMLAVASSEGDSEVLFTHYALKRMFSECAANMKFFKVPFEVVLAAGEGPAENCTFRQVPCTRLSVKPFEA